MADWSESKCAGFALASLIAGDRELAAADAVPPAIAARTRALIAHEGSEPKTRELRRERVEHLLRAVRPELILREGLPPRVHALLATRSRRRASGLPALRAGYTVPDDLWPRLYRIARYHDRGEPTEEP